MLRRGDFDDLADADLAPEPLEGARTIPAAWCVEPRFHELDRAVMAACWQPVGTLEALEGAGALAASVAGTPVIVTRSAGQGLRAFHNVCRHRGGPLAPKRGVPGVLQCRYHGWTYRPDGSLLGTPEVLREALGTTPVCLPAAAVEEWEGHVFVCAGATPAASPAPLAGRLAPLADRLGRTPLARLRFARRVEYDVRCNWKVYVDNYLEGYHVPHVHPELMALYDFRRYRTELFDDWSLQVGPLSDEANLYTPGGGEALYAFIFPNVMLNALPGRLQTNLVVPVAADRCRVVFQYYYDDAASDAGRARAERDHEFSDLVQQQDGEICERVQEGLASGSYAHGTFAAAAESGVHQFQQSLKAAYRRLLRG
jgi:choline monooxygenase